MNYLYSYKYLYPVGKTHEDVEPLTLECYDVEPTDSASEWRFKVVGRGEQVFRTSYWWALVENTPETLVHLAEWAAIRKQSDELLHKAGLAYRRVKRFASAPDKAAEEECCADA